MSSHREAPEISKDPSADNTDLYAFVSPDAPDTVTLIANYIPFQIPYGGPNFNEFADDVVYQIRISNSGHGDTNITYEFRFKTRIRNDETFLYNTGPITDPHDATWNRPQTYTVTRVIKDRHGHVRRHVLGRDLLCPPANVGIRSTPEYPKIAAKTYYDLGHGRKVFAGPRADAFHVDLGSIFDLGALRPVQSLHLLPLGNMPGVNGLRGLNVHTIALQLPISDVTRNGKRPTDVMAPEAAIGVWAAARRASARIHDPKTGHSRHLGRTVQVSRLGNPLVNEVINPMSEKDRWNYTPPRHDADFAKYVLHPELAGLLPVLYPGVFPNLAKYSKPRADLAAILLTGIPAGIIPGFQNFTGTTQADMLRLNVAVPPAKPGKEKEFGILGGDLAGFPNGRRINDDVTAIELRAVAGATIPLVDPSYKPDSAASILADGTKNDNRPYVAPLLKHFPYLSNPNSGYSTTPGHPGG